MKNKLFILVLLGQGVLVLIYPLTVYMFEDMSKLKESLVVINILVFIFLFLLLFSIRHLFEIASNGLKLDVLKSEYKNTSSLISELRQQKHDHMNHLQIVSGFAEMDNLKNVKSYLSELVSKQITYNELTTIENMTLNTLLNTKIVLAEKYNIELLVNSKSKVELNYIKDTDLASIFSNMIDNGIEYLMEHGKEKVLSLDIMEDEVSYLFRFSNEFYGDEIEFDELFSQGFSTKSRDGRGFGTYIVRSLVEKYDGEIELEYDEDLISFSIILKKEKD